MFCKSSYAAMGAHVINREFERDVIPGPGRFCKFDEIYFPAGPNSNVGRGAARP